MWDSAAWDARHVFAASRRLIVIVPKGKKRKHAENSKRKKQHDKKTRCAHCGSCIEGSVQKPKLAKTMSNNSNDNNKKRFLRLGRGEQYNLDGERLSFGVGICATSVNTFFSPFLLSRRCTWGVSKFRNSLIPLRNLRDVPSQILSSRSRGASKSEIAEQNHRSLPSKLRLQS